MGFLSNLLGKRECMNDFHRKYSEVMRIEWVTRIILVIPRDTYIPKSEASQEEYVRAVYKAVNPHMYEAIKDREQAKFRLSVTEHMQGDGFITPEYLFDSLDDHKVPPEYSAYLQTLRIEDGRIRIRARDDEEGRPDQEFSVPLKEPFIIDGKETARDVMLISAYKTSKPWMESSIWPTRPKPKLDLGKKK